jgi:hypothetical protein
MSLTCMCMWGLRSKLTYFCCHISCNKLKKLVAGTRTRESFLAEQHVLKFMSMKLFCVLVLSSSASSQLLVLGGETCDSQNILLNADQPQYRLQTTLC